MNSSVGPEFAAMGVFILLYLAFVGVMTIVTVVASCKIVGKAGYPWALGLLVLVPLANIVLVLILAFSEWPIQKELNAYKINLQSSQQQPVGYDQV